MHPTNINVTSFTAAAAPFDALFVLLLLPPPLPPPYFTQTSAQS
jgi:hypothetical protein